MAAFMLAAARQMDSDREQAYWGGGITRCGSLSALVVQRWLH